jgi:hypothetical protein
MQTYNDCHLWRELILLLMLGLFVLVAVLAGMLESRRKARRHAVALTGQGATTSVKAQATGHDEGSCVAQQRAWMDGETVPAGIKRAA